jgi:putative ABC transport system substrate-binding protein
MTPKRLQLLYEVVPTARVMALLVNPANPIVAEAQAREARSAAQTLGVNLHVLNASTERVILAELMPAGGLERSRSRFSEAARAPHAPINAR